MKDSLGDRMKGYYEEVSKTKLVRRMPVIIRLDGCHFHTFTRGFKKPFDEVLISAMQETMKYLCENIQGCVLGYTQSDEITLVLTDYAKLTTSAWFDYEVQKMCSVAASIATLEFNRVFNSTVNYDEVGEQGTPSFDYAVARCRSMRRGATFDARCFNIPKEEVANCLLWRQKDAERNSVNSLAQTLYSHRELQGIGLKDLIAKMGDEKGVYWGDLSVTQRRGSCCVKIDDRWVIDNNIPKFVNEGRDYIENRIVFDEEE